MKDCKVCKGQGYVEKEVKIGSHFEIVDEPCTKCKGTGKEQTE